MNSYTNGIKDEMLVIEKLKKAFSQVRKSTKDEDMNQDIDVWIGETPVSIKSQHICARTGNLGFELEVQDRFTGLFTKSWFYNSKAKGYIFLVGSDTYMVNKQSLVAYVAAKGWDSIKSLTPSKKEDQARLNHRHSDSRCGLIKLSTLLNLGIAKRIEL